MKNNNQTIIIIGIFAIITLIFIIMLPSQTYLKAHDFCKQKFKTVDCSCFAKCADIGNSYSICLNKCSVLHQYLNQNKYISLY